MLRPFSEERAREEESVFSRHKPLLVVFFSDYCSVGVVLDMERRAEKQIFVLRTWGNTYIPSVNLEARDAI